MKITKLFITSITSLLVALLAVACSDPLANAATSQGQVEVTLVLADENVGSPENSRSITPPSNPLIDGYRLYGNLSGGAASMLAEFEAITPGSKVNLESGTWNFTLQAIDTSNIVLLEASLSNVELAGTPAALTFILKPLSSGTGQVSLTVNWPASVAVASVAPFIDGVAQTPIATSGETTVTFSKSVESGGFLLVLSLKNAQGVEIASIPEYAKVVPNMTSTASITLSAGDFNSPPAVPTGFAANTSANLSDSATATLSLNWTDSSLNETGFEIEYSDDSGSSWSSLSGTLAAASISQATTLPRGSTRHYRIRAVNSFGTSAWSGSASFVAPWLVQFAANGGSSSTAQEIAPGGLVTKPADPGKYGSLFGGWYVDDASFATAWVFGTDTVTSSRSLYAKWTKAIVFDANGGTGAMTTLEWAEGSTSNLPANTFARSGYNFAGWSKTRLGSINYTDAASYTMSTGDTLYARWNRSDATAYTDFTYTTTAGAVTLTKYNGTASSVVIPDLILGNPVTSIASATSITLGAFYNKDTITSVYLPEALTNLGNYSFNDCDGLTSINGNASLINIGTQAFSSSSALATVTLPNSLTTIGTQAFLNCTVLANVSFGNSVATIGSSAFSGCTALSSALLGDSLTTLSDAAFSGCTNLTTVTLGDTLTIIGTSAFSGCTKLQSFALPGNLVTISYQSFNNCDALTSLSLPSGLKTIHAHAFNDCDGLTNLTTPVGLTSLGGYAFNDCDGLKTADIGGTNLHLGYDPIYGVSNAAFAGCDVLETVKLTGTVKYLYVSTFSSCPQLKSVDLGSSLIDIGSTAFYGCSKLTSLRVPVTVTGIGTNAFAICTSLTTVIFENSPASIADNAFQGCSNLQSLNLGTAVKTIGNMAFYGCQSLENLVTPNTLTSIGSSAFDLCLALRTVSLGSGLVTISSNAFAGCPSLLAISIPNSVTTLGSAAFQNDKSLVSASVGNAVTSLQGSTFSGCDNLETVTLGTSVASIGANDFSGCKRLASISIPTQVTSIGNSAFYGCLALASCTFQGNLVTSLGNSVFSNCDSLASISLPNSLTTLGTSAFTDCDNLVSVSTGNTLVAIPATAFDSCDKLASVTLGSGARTIGDSAFARCTSLANMDLSSITAINSNAFFGSTSLATVTLGENLASIAILAFGSCTSLNSVTLNSLTPPTLASVNAFSGNAPGRLFKVRNFEDNSILEQYKSTGNWAYLSDYLVEQ